MTEPLVRRAGAADAADIARLTLATAEHFLPAVFGPGIAAALGRLAANRGTLFSHAHARVAESGSRIVGMLLGYSGKVKAAEDLATGLALFRVLGPGLLLRIGSLLRLQRMIGTLGTQEWYVSNVAVYPEFRGRGIGSTLMSAAEKEARGAGAASVVLDVETDNDKAIRFYEGLGFVSRSRSAPLALRGGRFTFFRMGKPVALGAITPGGLIPS